VFTGHPKGVNIFYNDQHHLTYARPYHDTKEQIDLECFDALLTWMQNAVEEGNFLTRVEDLSWILNDVESTINTPLPQDWKFVLSRILDLEQRPRAYLNLMHCPKNVSNGGQKTTCSGIAKALGPESSLFGMYIILTLSAMAKAPAVDGTVTVFCLDVVAYCKEILKEKYVYKEKTKDPVMKEWKKPKVTRRSKAKIKEDKKTERDERFAVGEYQEEAEDEEKVAPEVECVPCQTDDLSLRFALFYILLIRLMGCDLQIIGMFFFMTVS
jgi:hypothetical protein